MGYELDKLKNLYGVSSATSTYGGTAMPVKPVAPAELPTGATQAQADAYNKAVTAYNTGMSAYTANLPKYQEDKALYDQYQQAYKQRLLGTNMYDPAANRQILQQPIYSNANPDLVKADRPAQYTISMMPKSAEQLPNLVSKYFNPAQTTPAGSATTPAAQPAALPTVQNQAQAQAKLDAARKQYQDQLISQYRLTNSIPYLPDWKQPWQQQLQNNMLVWDATNKLGSGNYIYAATGGQIDLNTLDKELPADDAQYAEGGAVKTNYADGDLVDLSADDEDTATTTTVSPSAYDALLARYKDVDADTLAQARADYRAKQQAIVDEMSAYKAQQEKVKPDKSEMYFRLAQAFLTPGKTGSFGEGLAQAGGVMADYQKDLAAQRRADAANMLTLGLKQKELLANMSQEDLKVLEAQQTKADTDRRTILGKMLEAEIASGKPQSEAGKQAMDEGFVPGTSEYTERVKKIYQQKIDMSTDRLFGMLQSYQASNDLKQQQLANLIKSSQRLTPAEMKLKDDSRSLLNSFDQSLGMLARAFTLNKDSFGNTFADAAQRKLAEQSNNPSQKLLNTQELENLLGLETVGQLKATFGGQFTAAEGQLLEQLKGIRAKSPAERAVILKNAYNLLKSKKAREEQRFKDISQGLYSQVDTAPDLQ